MDLTCMVAQLRPEELLMALQASAAGTPSLTKLRIPSDAIHRLAASMALLTALTAWPAPGGPKGTMVWQGQFEHISGDN